MKKRMNKIISLITKNKRKVVLLTIILLMVFTSAFIYINLTNPTKINSLIASVVNKGAPANKAFEDDIFYKVVVDAYNKENETSLPYTTNLTDEQLKTITSIDYEASNKEDSEKIVSAKGLEKLTALTYLDLSDNNISSIDLGNNTALTTLWLDNNDLTEIDLSENTELTYLDLSDNNISSIDLSKNTALTTLDLGYNNISEIDLSKNTALTTLYLSDNNLSSIDVSNNIALINLYLNSNYISLIDVSKNTALTTLDLHSNNISNIDVSANTALISLYLIDNNLSNIDLSKNIKLTTLYLYNNNLNNIDLSKNTELTTLYLYNNHLSNINLSKNTALKALDLSNNYLSNIDLSKNTVLTYLNLSNNYLSNIDLSKNTALTYLNLERNNLSSIVLHDRYDTLKLEKDFGIQYSNQTNINLGNDKEIKPVDGYNYYLGVKLVIPSEIDINTFKENLRLNNLTAKIYTGKSEKTTGQVKQDDILKIYDGDNLIQDIPINIMFSSYFNDDVFYKVVVDAYNKKNNTSLPYTTNLTDEQLSTITNISYSGDGKPSNEKIISTKGLEKLTNLTYLYLRFNNLSEIDLSKNTALTRLNLYSNNLSSIDLSNNTALTDLYLSGNNISNIDLSKNIKLTTLELYNNNISNIDLSNNTALTDLYLSGNNISNIDLSNNTALTTLNLDFNNLSNIDLSNNTALTDLDLYSNNLSSIDVNNNTSLTSLGLYSNNLSSIDVSNNIALTYLNLRDNNLISIDVSNNTALKTLNLGSNNLSSIDLSKNTALTRLELYNNPLSLGEYRLIKGTVVNGNSIGNIKLPEQFPITYEMEDRDIATYEDGTIKGLKSGMTSLKATLKGIKSSSSSNSEDLVVEGTIKVFDIKSDKYEINKEDKYIYTKNDIDSSTIMKNITVENGSGKIENSIFKVMDGDVVVEEYKIVGVSSSKYDMSKEYIYLRTNVFDKTKINCINCILEVNDNTLNIKYNGETLDSYKLLSYSSATYDLSKEYIYVGTNSFSLSNIKLVNLTTVVNDNTLEIKYGNTVMESYKIVSVSSSKYDLSKDNIRIGKDETFDLDNIKVINGAKEYSNGKLYIKYGNEVIKTYTLSSRLKGDINNDDKITIIDVSMLYRHIKKRSIITDQETLLISDINNDGKITIMDVSLLYRYVKGKINEL